MRKLIKYGKAYGGSDPEMIEGDIFRIIVKYPDFDARTVENVEKREHTPYSSSAACIAAEKQRVQHYGCSPGIGIERLFTYP